ncbi:glucose-1-phosphate adenylyltransferase family protein [Neomicrococcus aestuarii]|nr:glucose-1-phosphate adenylyltransferase family protein [Neomicrococcus aestuarii]
MRYSPVRSNPRVLALLLAGGQGSRLAPLTEARSKPAMPFAGTYRLIDFALSNLANSGIRNVWVVEQYKPFELNQHLANGRPWDLDGTYEGLRILPPFEGSKRDGFAEGNAHAIYQQIPKLKESGAEHVVVMSCDHVYQLDLRPVLEQHEKTDADVTIVTTHIDEKPSRYSVVTVDKDSRVTDFQYKPESPNGQTVATEVFVYKTSVLVETLEKLAQEVTASASKDIGEEDESEDSLGQQLGDYGERLLPALVEGGRAFAFPLKGYWRDLGTVDAYFGAHMQLLDGTGVQLGDPEWPIMTNTVGLPPAFIDQTATIGHSLVAAGARVSGEVEHSVIGPGVTIESGAKVSRCILLGDNHVTKGAVLESVIADIGATFDAGQVGETKPGPGNITIVQPPSPGIG